MHDHLLFLAGLDFSTLPEQLLNGILSGAIYALIALGYTMVYGVLKLINFAHGEVYMLGAYIALFGSYLLGFTPDAGNPQLIVPAIIQTVTVVSLAMLALGALMAIVGKLRKGQSGSDIMFAVGVAGVVLGGAGFLVAKFQPQAVDLLMMMIGSMVICAMVGVIIERFAYRPMRAHSRIASLITAIGVSLLIQYGGALFLPNSPPPSIKENVDPYRDARMVHLAPPSPQLVAIANQKRAEYDTANASYNAWMQQNPKADPFNLPPGSEGEKLREAMLNAKDPYVKAANQADNSAVIVHYQTGQVMILGATLVLMAVMTYLVLFTKAGRAMRAVSLDFDSASLMGVNVNNTVMFTFILGSALAGAGSMMQASFLGTPLTTFYGLMPGVKAFTAAVLGGIGNIPGAVVGGLLMGVAETLATWTGHSEYRDAIAFVVLILVLLFRPAGLLGSAKVEKV